MATFPEAYGDGDEEENELELYGLKNEYKQYDNSDEERDAVEEAFYMRIHYAAAVDGVDYKKQGSDSNNESADDVSTSSEQNNVFNSMLENNQKNISVDRIQDNKLVNSPLKTQLWIEDRQGSTSIHVDKKTRDETEKERPDKTDDSSLDDSVELVHGEEVKDSHSKYTIVKTSTPNRAKTTGSKDGRTVHVVSSEGDTTVFILSSDEDEEEDDDSCVSSKSPQKKGLQSSSSSSGLKITRKSFVDTQPDSVVQGDKRKQRTWKGMGASSSNLVSRPRIFDITSETISKSLKVSVNKLVKVNIDVAGSSKDAVGDSDGDGSDSDCMLIESMSEDEDMDFNFVKPLGMRSKKGVGDDDQQKNVVSSGEPMKEEGEGSSGPLCFNCNEYGHPARYCPQAKKNTPTIRPPSRYFQTESPDAATTPAKKGPKCLNCYEFGHLARYCPEPKRIPVCILCGVKGHYDKVCPNAICFNCNIPGHRAAMCKAKKPAKRQNCGLCQSVGHQNSVCPDLWRRYHLTMEPSLSGIVVPPNHLRNKWFDAKVYCSNCGKAGHHAYVCEEERMDNHTIVTSPFVTMYKSKVEKRRERKERKKRVNAGMGLIDNQYKPKPAKSAVDRAVDNQVQKIRNKISHGQNLTKKERSLCHSDDRLGADVVRVSNLNKKIAKQRRKDAKLTGEQKQDRTVKRKTRKRQKKQSKQELRRKLMAGKNQNTEKSERRAKAKQERMDSFNFVSTRGFRWSGPTWFD